MGANIRRTVAKKIFEVVDNGKLNPIEFQNKVIPSLQLKSTSNGHSIQFGLKTFENCINDGSIHMSEVMPKLLSSKFIESPAIGSAANRKAETDADFAAKAREVFSQMENGEVNELDDWNQYRNYTVSEMERVYGRLGVKFDVYAWESDYRKVNILKHLESMRKLGFLQTEADGKESFVLDESTRRPLLKSDGSTLYLTRDIVAIIDRQKTFNFDRMYYVAGNEQHQHFDSLFNIAKKIGVKNADKLYHVKFGKVEKMSTRKGNVVFLSDILDEIRDLMHHKQIMSPNTKVDLELDEKKTADIQGVSAIIAYELQRMPTASYEFDMENIVKLFDYFVGK